MTLKWDRGLLRDYAESDEVIDDLLGRGDAIAEDAAARAPRDTGEGADSIHAEEVREGGHRFVGVSWDPQHFYMRFQEEGTEFIPPRPFLRPAAYGAR